MLTSFLFHLDRYVYLRAVETNQVSEALTDVRVRIEDNSWSGGTPDLATGAGGKYRYLQFNKDPKNDQKYQAAALLRRAGGPASVNDVSPSYNVLTSDINAGRGGDYLYVAFLSREVFQIEKITT